MCNTAATEKEATEDRGDRQVLLVDDFPEYTETLADILEDEGYSVLTAQDGPTAVALARRHHPALVFLDLAMPGMNGEEVLRRLARFRQAPVVIIVTAVVGEEQAQRLLKLGALDVLRKPAPAMRLLQIARDVCGIGPQTAPTT